MSECCPCGSGQSNETCCQPYINQMIAAPNPVLLMRSRYTAYVRQDVNYLISTWHPDCQAENWRSSITESCADTHWLGLTIIAQTPGKNKDEGYVEFAARYTPTQTPRHLMIMRERSRFLRYDDRWYYVDGVHLQTGRNDHCPCGSGKKYKKCCGQ
ncbi:YchJ family protein [Pectobacteriaceae bacterium CE70]|nr:YchJ family protein [Pectobacteriaceae bacterium C52]WJV65071.1 YchJ family protein [Pectobacteriaceae bacterium CE70]WJY09091.1 YchJ family protein [Pectobacteriaceae bacterium C80]